MEGCLCRSLCDEGVNVSCVVFYSHKRGTDGDVAKDGDDDRIWTLESLPLVFQDSCCGHYTTKAGGKGDERRGKKRRARRRETLHFEQLTASIAVPSSTLGSLLRSKAAKQRGLSNFFFYRIG